MDASLASRLAQSVRAADPDRYFSALFAPAPLRAHLFALYAFNHEVARIAETVREPMLGAIRLEWWRETLEYAAKGQPRNHDVARGLASLFAAHKVELSVLEASSPPAPSTPMPNASPISRRWKPISMPPAGR
jgi:phytoene synthase